MDSPSSSVTLITRDGSSSAEDDGALFAEGLAKEAAVLFQSGKFADCLRILNQLLEKEGDPKVWHNIAIAESLQDGCSDPRRLIKALETIKEQSEELARASGEHLEVSSNNGSEHTASMRGNNAAPHPISSVAYNDVFDTSVATFNIAVIWYHLHEYTRSFSYLDTLYQNIEPIGEGTALSICLLLLDVALLSHNASRSAVLNSEAYAADDLEASVRKAFLRMDEMMCGRKRQKELEVLRGKVDQSTSNRENLQKMNMIQTFYRTLI